MKLLGAVLNQRNKEKNNTQITILFLKRVVVFILLIYIALVVL